ncbi:hypothetical protein MRX96_048076 [Rhipicephalus microplus]
MCDHAVKRSLRHLTTFGRQPCILRFTRCSRQLDVGNVGDCGNGSNWRILQIYIEQRPVPRPAKMSNDSFEANPPDQGDCLPLEAVQKRPVAQTYPSGYEPAMLEPAAGGL